MKPDAATPPNNTEVAPLKPDPRIVTGSGANSEPPYGITPVMLGTVFSPRVSTYSKIDEGPGMLESSSLSVMITSAGPAPSCGEGGIGGRGFKRRGQRRSDRCSAPNDEAARRDLRSSDLDRLDGRRAVRLKTRSRDRQGLAARDAA